MCGPRKRETAERSMSWIVTQRRCFAPVAAGASLLGQTTVGWPRLKPRNQEKRVRGIPLRGYVFAYYIQQQPIGNMQKCKTRERVGSSALDTPYGRQTGGSQGGLGRLGPTPSTAHSSRTQPRQTTTRVGLGVCSKLSTHNKSAFFPWEDCFDLYTSQLNVRWGLNPELNIWIA